MGLASRTAAIWAIERTKATFKDSFGARFWLTMHEQLLAQKDFWNTADQHLLWTRFVMREDIDSPRKWTRLPLALDVQWSGVPPTPGTRMRVIPKADSTAIVCDGDLWPVGRIAMPFDSTAWHTEGVTGDDGKLQVTLYGPATHAVN
jgi:hypothetical protein